MGGRLSSLAMSAWAAPPRTLEERRLAASAERPRLQSGASESEMYLDHRRRESRQRRSVRAEAFMRCVFAHEVDAGIRLGGLSLDEACDRALARVVEIGGRGGCVAVDAAGHVAMPFTTTGMYRGWIDAAGEPRVAILRDDPLDESTPAS